MKAYCTANATNAIKHELKKEQFSAKQEKNLLAKKRKHYDNPEKKNMQLIRDNMVRANQ